MSSSSRKGRLTKTRRLSLEPLEHRALLSVTVLGTAFKAFEFTTSGNYTGKYTEPGYLLNYSGVANVHGAIVYDSPTHGTGSGTATGSGIWNDPRASGAYTFSGHGNIEDQNGALAVSGYADTFQGQPFPAGPFPGTGTLSTSDFAANVRWSFSIVSGSTSGSWSGTFVPVVTDPFSVTVNAAGTPAAGIGVTVDVAGRVHTTTSRSTPVTNVNLYWSKGPTLADRIGGPLADKIPIYWNSAGGAYSITGLPLSPVDATHLLLVTQYDGQTEVAALPLPPEVPPEISINDATVTEGDKGNTKAVFTINLSQASRRTVTVLYATADGTANQNIDYKSAVGKLTFKPGETSKTITVNVVGDLVYEPDETFNVNLSNPTNASVANTQGNGVILNDDPPPPSISIGDATVTEGDKGNTKAVFTVSLSGSSKLPVQVLYATADGTATVKTDYKSAIGKLTFKAGETSKTITVNVVGDLVYESDETFYVNLSNSTNAFFANTQGKGLILNDDPPPPSISINDATVTEGDKGTVNAVFTVSLSGPSKLPVQVLYATADGSAIAKTDYKSATGKLTFPGGTLTKTITVQIIGDKTPESTEDFFVNLSSAINGTLLDGQGAGTILDNDVALLSGSNMFRAAATKKEVAGVAARAVDQLLATYGV
jgi:hypothetical protein